MDGLMDLQLSNVNVSKVMNAFVLRKIQSYAVITWSDAYFDDVSASQDQLFHHLSSDHVSCLCKIKIIIKNVLFITYPGNVN